MSLIVFFAVVYSVAWVVGLRVLPRLRRRSGLIMNLFVGGIVGLLNFVVGGVIHYEFLSFSPAISMAIVFTVRTFGNGLGMIGFFDRKRGRTGSVNAATRWGAIMLGGLYLAAVGLGLEFLVRMTARWDVSDLLFDPATLTALVG